MGSTVSALFEEVASGVDVQDARNKVEERAERGDFSTLVALAGEVEARLPATSAEARGRLHALSDHIEETLARRASVESARALLDIARQPRDARFQGTHSAARRERDLAGLLARWNPTPVLRALLPLRSGPRDLTELFACYVQELVLRGESLEAEPAVRELWARLVEGGHPLALLPLRRGRWESSLGRLLGVEDVEDALRDLQAHLASARAGDADEEDTLPLGPRTRRSPEEVPLPASAGAIIDAWAEDVAPARDFRRAFSLRPPQPGMGADLLAAFLEDADLGGLVPTDDPGCERQGPEDVVATLFTRAAFGAEGWVGAQGAAYGRLATWRTLAGLMGVAGEPRDWRVLEQQAGACRWFRFTVTTSRPSSSSRLGLACLRPGGTTLALLAASLRA
ncbi:DUF6183 family protein [Myxococcus sp. K15C18031901]|uniref:DUF6183 family protein n=1 Tax=Myxococcus dinghuensis TaxID=2906761 RepID=UPI0020A75E18|nr:DUF6183 family protein [Myxococcus dinghuensis]MCP3102277.1 DUF6183 family protein [Myxococcus dinghuensis]